MERQDLANLVLSTTTSFSGRKVNPSSNRVTTDKTAMGPSSSRAFSMSPHKETSRPCKHSSTSKCTPTPSKARVSENKLKRRVVCIIRGTHPPERLIC